MRDFSSGSGGFGKNFIELHRLFIEGVVPFLLE
jgi:hypothetical protein